MFQVVVVVCAVASVLMLVILSACSRCVSTIFVATNISAKKINSAATARLQKFAERPKTLPPQVPQLLAMGLLHRCIEHGKQFEAFRGDTGHYHSPVLGFPAA